MLVGARESYGQLYPERSKIRSGNKAYDKAEFQTAEEYYSRALALTPDSPEARFNLADARYKMEMYEDAVQTLAPLKADSVASDIRQKAFYNEGNALFKQSKYQEALESFKSALRINPADTSAKFNLAYTQKMLENQDENQDGDGGGGGDNQDENQDENQNDQNEDQQDQGGDDQQDQNGDQDQQDDQGQDQQDQNGDQEQDQQDQNPQQGEGQMSQQEAEQLLQAIQDSEDNTREKVKAERAAAQSSSIKNW